MLSELKGDQIKSLVIVDVELERESLSLGL